MNFWPFSRKKSLVELQDLALADLAQMFVHNPDDPTPGHELLNASKFDFTLESLSAADQHIEVMRNRNLQGQELTTFVLRCGAYVGEVLRQHETRKEWHWVDYEQAVRLDSKISSFGRAPGTAAMLWDGKSGYCFPLAKVGKYLENGAGDSVKFFVQVMIAHRAG